jgi:hypothetical protein
MAMVTHTFEQPSRSSERQGARDTHALPAHGGAIKEFCLCALIALAAGALLATIIAAETAFYLRSLID